MFSARAYDLHVEQLFDKLRRITGAFSSAGIPYQIVGGMGFFLHVNRAAPECARMTPNLDLTVYPSDLASAIAAAESVGFRTSGNCLTDVSCRGSEVHLIPVDRLSSQASTIEGVTVAPVTDLVLMKLTSFRLKDKVQIQDMDAAGLITPEIEHSLSEPLRERLREVRATR